MRATWNYHAIVGWVAGAISSVAGDTKHQGLLPRTLMKGATMLVKDGTPIHTENLCSTCRWAHHFKGMAESTETVHCLLNTGHPLIFKSPVQSCSHYDDKRRPSRYDMEQIAWIFVTGKAGHLIGFISPEQRREQEINFTSPSAPKVGF